MGKKFGDPNDPLLVSVRSGAAVSMPGMMDTVLNLGLNDAVIPGLIKKTGNERFVWDSYRRLINMFGDVVMGIHHDHFEHELAGLKKKVGVKEDTDLTPAQLKELCELYKAVYKKTPRRTFPPTRQAARPRHPRRLRVVEPADRNQLSRRSTRSRACSARPSMCRRWSSATWATRRRPVCA